MDTYGTVLADEFYLYGVSGQKIGTYYLQTVGGVLTFSSVSPWTGIGSAPYVYFGRRLLAQQDRLGSIGKYYPYGEDKGTGNPANDNVQFATYTRDSATGLDYADQRYYSSQFGRFMTADPYMASGGVGNPRSWNRYSYVLGDPVNFNDRHGLDAEDPGNECEDCGEGGEAGPMAAAEAGNGHPPGDGGSGGPPSNPQNLGAPTDNSVTVNAKIDPDTSPITTSTLVPTVFPVVPVGATVVAEPTAPVEPANVVNRGYLAYASCFLTTIARSLIVQPEITDVSIWSIIQGVKTGATWGSGAGLAGGIFLAVNIVGIEDSAARSCSRQSGYTPWILQHKGGRRP